MRLQHNVAALSSWRANTESNRDVQKSLGKLASGLRITSAADDAAGLSISEKMRAQIRGLTQSSRNIQDGISLLQTSEGGLEAIQSLIQRGRELAVQAANDGPMTKQDKQTLQDETKQLLKEIDRISGSTEFNGMQLLNQPEGVTGAKKALLEALPGMLQNSEKLIETYFGLQGDHQKISIFLDDTIDGAGGTLAYVSAGVSSTDYLGSNIQLHVDMSDFPNFVAPNGNADPANYLDRTIAHEMVHAVMDRKTNLNPNGAGPGMDAVPTWFNEGMAEYIKGGADRVKGTFSIGGTSASMVAKLGSGYGWDTSSPLAANESYSAGYAAVRFLAQDLALVPNGGLKSFMTDYLTVPSGGNLPTLDAAIQAAKAAGKTSYANLDAFMTAFQGPAGQAFIDGINSGYTANDVGAIGRTVNAAAAVDDTLAAPGTDTNPMQYWDEVWPTYSNSTGWSLHIGANANQSMFVSLGQSDTNHLGIANVDLTDDSSGAITRYDEALQQVSSTRSKVGALQNRLEHSNTIALNSEENLTASESRIRDVDMAKEMMLFTKSNILNQASMLMLAQANQSPQSVLQLLRSA